MHHVYSGIMAAILLGSAALAYDGMTTPPCRPGQTHECR